MNRSSSGLPYPVSHVDLYDDEVLLDPYPYFRGLRDAGPAVWLERCHAWAIPRYAELRTALADWETFSAASGVGISREFNQLSAGNAILSNDPPQHTILREVLTRHLNTRKLRAISARIERDAQALVDGLVERGTFDAVADLAQVFPVTVVADFVGLPAEGRHLLLEYADGVINSFGPLNSRTAEAFPIYRQVLHYLNKVAVPGNLVPGGAGMAIYDAVARGEIAPLMGPGLMSAYLAAGIDTTVNSISNAIYLFARNPEQWDLLRRDPERTVPVAYIEVLRYDPPVQTLSRMVTRPTRMGAATLEPGDRALMMFGSANRDERQYHDPDRFDVQRNPRDHLALGHGVHNCVGAGLAKLEGHAILTAMANRVKRFEIGEPKWRINNVVRGLASLPVTVHST